MSVDGDNMLMPWQWLNECFLNVIVYENH
jgi:hypothetical protein